MKKRRRCVIAALLLSGCGDRGATNSTQTTSVIVPTPTQVASPMPAYSSTPTPENYVERDGDRYLYVTAVSEEDRKKGSAAGKVVMYQYLGIVGGKHRLRSIAESGRALVTWECSVPCRIIKSVGAPVERIPYEPNSIIGGAFQDALAGRLEPITKARGYREEQPTESAAVPAIPIPAQFWGEWNQQPEHCGTSLNDSRLRITAREIAFYESDGEVKRVISKSARAIVVTATLSGEGRVWSDQFEFVLSRSGDELSQSDFVRYRCK